MGSSGNEKGLHRCNEGLRVIRKMLIIVCNPFPIRFRRIFFHLCEVRDILFREILLKSLKSAIIFSSRLSLL